MRFIRMIAAVAALALLFAVGCSDDDNGVDPSNNAPVINSITAEPDSIYANESTVATADTDDPDGDACSCQWDVHGLEMEAIGGTANSVTLKPGCDCLENDTDVWILAIVSDGRGGVTTDSVKVHVKKIG